MDRIAEGFLQRADDSGSKFGLNKNGAIEHGKWHPFRGADDLTLEG